MKLNFLSKCLAATALAVAFTGAHAALIYQNSAGSSMSSIDKATGAQATAFTQNKGNGRGIVVVGDIIYYTVADSGSIFKRSVSTNADLGVAFSIAGARGLQAISYDGTDFWVGDYSGTTKAFKVSGTTGVVLKTIDLGGAGKAGIEGFYDGLEYFNGKLIANKYDGGFARAGGNQYSVYDLDGNLLVKDFINTNGHGNGTGIAFDGTDFFVADIFNSKISQWDGLTGAFKGSITLTGGNFSSMEDISVDFAARGDTCGGPNQPPCEGGGNVPTPGSLPLVGVAMMALGWVMRRRQRG